MGNWKRSLFLLLLLLSGCGWDGTPTRHNDFVSLTSIEISAESSTIAKLTSTRLSVKGNYSGLFTRDITDQVAWSSDTPAVAGFLTAAIPNRVSGIAPGTATLTATAGSISAAYTLTVSSATITAPLAITPADPSIPRGLSKQLLARGTFSDATTQDLTFDADWASSAAGVASVSNSAASKGLAQALAVGTSTISATFDGVSGSAVMTVTGPVLRTITLSPANPSILTLSKIPLKATGTYTDGSVSDITPRVAWNSSNTTIATIGGDGTVTTLTQGTTTISATLDGVSQSTSLKATGGNLTGITVSLTPQTLVKGTTARITATGAFTNGSKRDITGAVTWKVADPSRATVTTPVGNLAWLNALDVTAATIITATYGSLSPATATLAVIAPPQLQSIALSSPSLELTAGASRPLTVTATFSDGTTQDVTASSDWKSNNETIATVGTSGLAAGRVTGVAAGVARDAIDATYTYNGQTVSATTRATVTVRTPALLSLAIAPVTSTVAAGYSTSFTATANYGDGTHVDVTNDAKWSWVADAPNVAILSDSENHPGQVVGVDAGSANLTVSFGGKTPLQNATITVTGP